MINFDIEKKGYNREQVSEYFERVQEEYDEMYTENQALRLQLEQAQQQLAREQSRVSNIPPEQIEAIALALIDAETEAKRIVTAAREKAWQILTDAKKGLPVAEDTEKPSSLPEGSETPEQAAEQPKENLENHDKKSAVADMDRLLEALMSKSL